MNRLVKIVLAASFLLTQTPTAFGEINRSTSECKIVPAIENLLLSNIQQKALCSAMAEGISDLQVVTFENSGRFVAVVLMGESHAKSKKKAEAEKNLFQSFKLRGAEGVTKEDLYRYAKEHHIPRFQQDIVSWVIRSLGTVMAPSSIKSTMEAGFSFNVDGTLLFNSNAISMNVPGPKENRSNMAANAIPASEFLSGIVALSLQPLEQLKILQSSLFIRALDGETYALSEMTDPNGFVAVMRPFISNPGFPYINVGLERGSIEPFEKECPTCDFGRELRERRMVSNLIPTLKTFHMFNSIFLVFGQHHMKGLLAKLSSQPEFRLHQIVRN